MWMLDPVLAVAFTTPHLKQTLPCKGKRAAKAFILDFLKSKCVMADTLQELSLRH